MDSSRETQSVMRFSLESLSATSGGVLCGTVAVPRTFIQPESLVEARISSECHVAWDTEIIDRPMSYMHTRHAHCYVLSSTAVALSPLPSTCIDSTDIQFHFRHLLPEDMLGTLRYARWTDAVDPEWVEAGEKLLFSVSTTLRLECRVTCRRGIDDHHHMHVSGSCEVLVNPRSPRVAGFVAPPRPMANLQCAPRPRSSYMPGRSRKQGIARVHVWLDSPVYCVSAYQDAHVVAATAALTSALLTQDVVTASDAVERATFVTVIGREASLFEEGAGDDTAPSAAQDDTCSTGDATPQPSQLATPAVSSLDIVLASDNGERDTILVLEDARSRATGSVLPTSKEGGGQPWKPASEPGLRGSDVVNAGLRSSDLVVPLRVGLLRRGGSGEAGASASAASPALFAIVADSTVGGADVGKMLPALALTDPTPVAEGPRQDSAAAMSSLESIAASAIAPRPGPPDSAGTLVPAEVHAPCASPSTPPGSRLLLERCPSNTLPLLIRVNADVINEAALAISRFTVQAVRTVSLIDGCGHRTAYHAVLAETVEHSSIPPSQGGRGTHREWALQLHFAPPALPVTMQQPGYGTGTTGSLPPVSSTTAVSAAGTASTAALHILPAAGVDASADVCPPPGPTLLHNDSALLEPDYVIIDGGDATPNSSLASASPAPTPASPPLPARTKGAAPIPSMSCAGASVEYAVKVQVHFVGSFEVFTATLPFELYIT